MPYFVCESGICRQLWRPPKEWSWGTRQQGIRASKLGHVLTLNNLAVVYALGRVRLQLQIESRGFRTELIWGLNLIRRCLFGQSGDFLIWSSFRSATASNSHALPYIVVELELLASDQSGAFFSRSIVQVKSGALLVRLPTMPLRHHPYRRQYYCSCRPYTMSS